MILFPAIDLKDGKCVRLIQGDFKQSTTYNESPLEQAKIFEDSGVEYLHCVDLDGALKGNFKNIKSIEQIKKNTKPDNNQPGGIIDKEMPLHISNIAYYDPDLKKGVKISYKINKDKKIRINKSSGKEI